MILQACNVEVIRNTDGTFGVSKNCIKPHNCDAASDGVWNYTTSGDICRTCCKTSKCNIDGCLREYM